MDNTWLLVLAVLAGVLVALVLAAPRLFRVLGPRLRQTAGAAYQRRFFKQVKKKYPLLAERLAPYELKAESQDAFQAAIRKLPPQEAMKLQAEFNRLRENFVSRHPEVAPLFGAGQDPRMQGKAIDGLMKLPEDRRQALEKDLLWAWDQLRGRFPRLMVTLEGAFRKKG